MHKIIFVHINVKPENIQAFIDASYENARNSVKEEGVVRFDIMQQSDDPTKFVLIEVYKNDEAPLLHKKTSHYLAWKDKVEQFMAEPRQGIKYHSLFSADDIWG